MIVIVPLIFVLGLAIYFKKYVRGVTDFLAAGRVAGRYVISVGDLQACLSVISLIALCESQYQCGMAIGLWNQLIVPISIFMSLTGYCLYRYRGLCHRNSCRKADILNTEKPGNSSV